MKTLDKEKRYECIKKVEELQEFYIHLVVFITVNIAHFVLNMLTTSNDLWFVFSLLAWGIGLSVYSLVIVLGGKWGSRWEDKKIKELMKKEDKDIKI